MDTYQITKRELIEMLESFNDNDRVRIIGFDGTPEFVTGARRCSDQYKASIEILTTTEV